MSYANHGPYDFGWPDELVNIHFPGAGGLPKNSSMPWFYYLTRQVPTYFQYIGSQLGGHGWQCAPFLPVIRILPIDSQKMTPTKLIGFGSIEEAIRRTNSGEPISQDAWGRFNFKNSFFWKVMGQKPPTWASFAGGIPKSRIGDGHEPINSYIQKATEKWRDNWNTEEAAFNSFTLNVAGNGEYAQYGPGVFALPVPGAGASTINLSALKPDSYYFGPVSPFCTFERGQALIWKQSWAARYEIAQLDPTEWDMNVFPPQDATNPLYEKPATSISGKANGYNPNIAFPLNSPIIAGLK